MITSIAAIAPHATHEVHSRGVGTFFPGKTHSYEARVFSKNPETVEKNGVQIYFGNPTPDKIKYSTVPNQKWTRQDSARLGELIEKYAIGTLSDEEEAEEKRLQIKRRATSDVPARPYDELIRDAQRAQALNALMIATENYIKVHGDNF